MDDLDSDFPTLKTLLKICAIIAVIFLLIPWIMEGGAAYIQYVHGVFK